MVLNIIWLIVGLGLILVGANALTDGASAIARRMGISDLIVGLTVVAFGTSAPEFVISVLSAFKGNAELAVGNVVGSNIFNILMIIGVTALVRPIIVERNIMTAELPMLLLSAVLVLILGNGTFLDGTPTNILTRTEGLLLLIFFLLFLRYTIASARKSHEADTGNQTSSGKTITALRAWIYVAAGLAALIFGGNKFVDGASGLAKAIGVSDAIIGLTIVAVGTSLPELATSVVAAIKGRPGLAVGNVIGSNIFNVLFVLGSAATVAPLPFGTIGNLDLFTLLGASILFYLFAQVYKTRTITRIEGLLLIAGYIAYTVALIAAI